MTANYGLSFLEGVLTFISPCMLPMLPVYLFYLAGVAGQEDNREEYADSRAVDSRTADSRAADSQTAQPRADAPESHQAESRAAGGKAAPCAVGSRTTDALTAAPRTADARTADPRTADSRAADSQAADPESQQPESHAPDSKASPSQPRRSGGRLFRNAAAFVAGFTLVFVSMGAAATAVGAFLNGHLALFRLLGGMLMILFGLSFAGVFRLGFLQKERRLSFQPGKLTVLRSLAFGAVFAFGWTPCVGYLLSSSLLMASTSGSVPQGMAMLLLYSLGLGLPFLFSSLIYHELKETFRFLQRHNRLIGILSGIVMIAAGVLTLTGRVLTNW
ncbi:sulfite exporter TauE/SafE family protein [Paenibacillus sp. HN-1]|uniref:cytochrome c biogenesis protein CcdA n=1 Tax=Paenibacillus TaxID=44249 RepID=UPI001CA985C6|nr:MULTISPECIES: cytochrome c biogenesis protein CcdA [Paenibacillus]MBY9077327.1 sulfite exporter TauE/SafE family protein [Paenibacillus sp. CGMCC 1.18879]MBY9085647.1 sulfite exporter TauE/SafE family protein [Paenibacillus sinensis]